MTSEEVLPAPPTERGQRLTRRTVGALGWTVASTGAQYLLKTVIVAILARLLVPADFGLIVASSLVINLAEDLALLGVGPALVQRQELTPTHVRTGFTLTVVLTLVFSGVLWAASPLIATFFRIAELAAVLRVTILYLPLSGASIVANSLLQRDMRFRELSLVDIASYVVGYAVVGVPAALFNLGVWALVAAMLTQNLVRAVCLLVIQPHPKGFELDRAAARELMLFGGGISIGNFLNYIALQGDNFVVGRTLGVAALGLYSRAYNLMITSVKLFGTQLDRVLFPAMAQVQDDPVRLGSAFRRGVSLLAMISLPVSAVLYVLAPEVVHVMLGRHWDAAIVPFRILVAGLIFRISYKMSSSLARAKGKIYEIAWLQGLYAVMVVGGAWIGQHYGLEGVAYGVLIAIAVQFFLLAHLALKLISESWAQFAKIHVPGIITGAVIGGAAWATAAALRPAHLGDVSVLLGVFAVSGATFLALARFVPKVALGPDGIWMLQMLVNQVMGKVLPKRVIRPLRRLLGVKEGGSKQAPGTEATNGMDDAERGGLQL